jgi:hypothetical protein
VCPTLAVDGQCGSGQPPRRFFTDNDGDGVGAGAPRLFCSQPRASGVVPERLVEGRVLLDCDDSDAGVAVNPLALERCNGLDDNCNGQVDEGLPNERPWFRDVDGDGFGAEGDVLRACAQPPGYAARAGDCDVMAADVFPGAPERCNNRDDNCNGQPDDAPFVDAESPGVAGAPTVDCTQPLGACSAGGVECRYDAGAAQNQLACIPRTQPRPETCNGVDDDCNLRVDDAPGCGGPPSLTSTPRVLTGAVRTTLNNAATPSRLPAGCLKDRAGADAQSWFDPTWVGSQGINSMAVFVRHTWYAEAEPNTTWDLSGRTQLSVALTDRTGLRFTGFPIFTSFFPGPVVTLCGATDADYLRLSPMTNQLGEGDTLRVTVNLTGATPGWTREASPGFSLGTVRRVELTVGPNPIPDGGAFEVRTFNVTVFPDAGFVR